jgi:hypothetical protein
LRPADALPVWYRLSLSTEARYPSRTKLGEGGRLTRRDWLFALCDHDMRRVRSGNVFGALIAELWYVDAL